MSSICKHRLFLAPLLLLVCGGVWLLPLLPAQSQETGATPDAEETVAEKVRRLAETEKNPRAAIKVATQYLAANTALTMERQRVHYELGAAHLFAKNQDAALATFRQVLAQYEGLDLDRASEEYRVDDALLFVGVLQGIKGDHAAAMKCYEALIEKFPQSNRRPRAMLSVGNDSIASGETERGLKILRALISQYPDSESAPSAILNIVTWLLRPEASVDEQSCAANVAAAHANLELLATKYGDAVQTTDAWGRVLRYHNQRRESDQVIALGRRMIGLYFDADPEAAGNALSVAALALLDVPELTADDHALAKRALTRYVDTHPGASCPPRERYRLACLRVQDAAVDPAALEEAHALARELATQYAGDRLEPEALRLATQFWLSPEASVDEQSHAANVTAAHANLELLATKYGDAVQTTDAWNRVLRYHNQRKESDQVIALARRMIGLYLDADPKAAGNALSVAAVALLDAPELAADDRALAESALTRYVDTHPGASCPPKPRYRLACLRAQDAAVDPAALEEAYALARELATQYAGHRQEAQALRWANRFWLSKEATPTEANRAQSYATAKGNMDTLLAKHQDSPETWPALHDLLRHFKREDSDFFDEAEIEIWARRIFTTFAGDMDRLTAMKSAHVPQLTRALQMLGRQNLALLVSDAQRLRGGDLDRLRSRQCADTVCGLVLSQVASAEAKDRQQVWDIGKLYVAHDIDELSDRTFGILDGLVEAMASDLALAEAIVSDLAKRTRDIHGTLPKLERQLASLALERRIEDAPSSVQKSFRQAQELQSNGDLAGATASFRAIVDGSDCPSDIKNPLNRRIVTLLLEQQTDLAALDKYLPALRRQGEDLDTEAWNLSCRALFRRVAAAEDDRATVWKNGLGALAARTIVVRQRTLDDLDKLTEFLGRDGADLALTIVTDLLLCAPDGHSMRRLQWRRIAIFTKAGDFDSARAAAAMDVALAASGGQSVTPFLERFEEVLRSGGATETGVAQTATCLLCGSSGDAPTHPALRLVDEPMRKAAREALKLAAESDSPRRVAYLNLLAGNVDQALLAGRDALLACASARQAAEALGDIYAILAVADGSLANANRFADWLSTSLNETSDQTPPRTDDKLLAILADGNWHVKTTASGLAQGQPFATWSPEDRAAVARAFSGQLAEALATSAGSAMGKGNKALATGLWALTLRGTAAPDRVRVALDSMIESLKTHVELPDARQLLRDILPLVPAVPHRRVVLVGMAGLAHEERLFDDCLALLDEADALDTDAGQKDFAVAMLRASAMLELDEYDAADALLTRAARWDGTDEDKARCLFITACLRLKQGQMKDAGEILQKLTDQYPEASVAARARQLAARIK